MTCAASNLLHNEFRARKQFWSSLNHLIIYLKYHFADSEAKAQLKKNEQEENYSWYIISAHAQTSQHILRYWSLYRLSYKLYSAAHESDSVADQTLQKVFMQLIISQSQEHNLASQNYSSAVTVCWAFSDYCTAQKESDLQNQNSQIQKKSSQDNYKRRQKYLKIHVLNKRKELFILRILYYISVKENCEWRIMLCYNFSEESKDA